MRAALIILILPLALTAAEFDVLLYNNVPNPNGVPTNWPARIEATAGRPSPWILMSTAELTTYQAFHYPAYSNWQSNFRHTNEVASARQRLKSKLTNEVEFLAMFTALARLLVSEFNPLRTQPTNVFAPRTEAQAKNALLNNAADILDELLTTNTVPPPP